MQMTWKRRLLLALLALQALALLVRFAIPGVVLGGRLVAGGSEVSALLDSETRFLFALAGGVAVVLIQMGRRPERYGALFGPLMAAIFAGGSLRVVSIALYGLPPLQAAAGVGVELLTPPLCLLLQRSLTTEDG